MQMERFRHLRRGGFEGPQPWALQIDAARRLAPAETYRGHEALLLGCASSAEMRRAQESLHELWPVDAVHPLVCPIGSWTQAIECAPGTASWLQHYVMREVRRRDPSLLAILAHGGDEEARVLPAVIGMLRAWGAVAPIAALRVRAEQEVEWLATPPIFEREEAG